MACVSCKFPASRRSNSEAENARKNGDQERIRKQSGCDLSHCTFKTAPVVYKPNEKNYYSEMHGAWRYHPHNRKFRGKYPFSKTNYLRVGPKEELIWGRNTWDIDDYYKRCCRNKLCRPIQYRGYTAWLKPAPAMEDLFFTTGPQGGLVLAGDGKELDNGWNRGVPPGCRTTALSISEIPDKGKTQFRFLPCGPLRPGWGCSGKLSCHLDDGFCPKEPKPCECRGVFRGDVGCRECGGREGKPSMCRQHCCGLDKFRPYGDQSESRNQAPKKCCPYRCPSQYQDNCPDYEPYPLPPRVNFGRKTLFRPLEKVPPVNLDLAPFLNQKYEKETIGKEKGSGSDKGEPEQREFEDDDDFEPEE